MATTEIIKLRPETANNVCYEVIKKEAIEAAFRDALIKSQLQIFARIDSLIDTMTATAPQGLWCWGFTSRWDCDMWW